MTRNSLVLFIPYIHMSISFTNADLQNLVEYVYELDLPFQNVIQI